MAKAESKSETSVPVTKAESSGSLSPMQVWRPFESLRHQVDRLFEYFTLNPFRLPLRRPAFDIEPFWHSDSWVAALEVTEAGFHVDHGVVKLADEGVAPA